MKFLILENLRETFFQFFHSTEINALHVMTKQFINGLFWNSTYEKKKMKK